MSVSRKELLKMLDEAIILEERSVPIYQKHLHTALFWSGLSKDDAYQLRVYLNVLARESEKHARILEKIKKKVTGSEKDVF